MPIPTATLCMSLALSYGEHAALKAYLTWHRTVTPELSLIFQILAHWSVPQ